MSDTHVAWTPDIGSVASSPAPVLPAGSQLEHQLDVLERVTGVFGVMHRVRDIYEHICQQVVDLLGVEMCAIALYDPERRGLVGRPPAVGVSDDDIRSYFVPLDEASPVSRLWEAGAFFRSNDVLSDPLVKAMGLEKFARKIGVRQTMIAGIRLEGQLVGIIQPSNKCDGAPFGDSDARLLSIYSGQVAIALANRRLYQDALVERDKLSRLHHVALAVQRAPSLTEKLRRIAEGIRETGWRRVIISLCDPQDTGSREAPGLRELEMIFVGFSGQEEQALRQRAQQPDYWSRWLRGELEASKLGLGYFLPADAAAHGGGWQAGDVLFIPVFDQLGRVVCMINLDAPLDGRRPTAESLRIIELFAQEAAASIETAQLYQAFQDQIIVLGERAQRLALLNRVSSLFGSTLDLRAMLSSVSEQVVEAFGVDHCAVMLNDQDNRIGHCVAEHPARGMAGYSVSLRDSPELGKLQAAPAPVEIKLSTGGAGLSEELARWLKRFGVEASLIVPLLVQGRLAGWLGLNFMGRQRALSPDQVELCQTIANQTAAAVEKAQLFERVQSTLYELEATNRTQAQLLATVQELSTPVVPVWEGILILPLIGFIDSDRAQHIMEGLLTGIEQNRAKVVLLDVTGVPVVDSGVADHLMRAARAAQLLGARPVLVGIRPEVAQAIVRLGVHLRDLVTRSDLQSGLEYALSVTERRVVQV